MTSPESRPPGGSPGARESMASRVAGRFKKRHKAVLEARDEQEELWNTVGYHRITGGFFYSYVLMIGGAVIGLVTVSWLLPEFLPYPEINGYRSIVTGTILGFWFGLFDLNLGGGGGFSDGMSRFIGQYASTDPRRAVKYIQFYVVWQMVSGVIQVSIFVLLAILYFPHTNFSHLSWFIIAESLVQYPGMLMIMEAALKAFQRGDKLAWLVWLQNTVFQVTVNIIFLVIGKWWGSSDPAVGELMGITIFYILSQFIDDYINLALGSVMFGKILKPYGIRIRDLFSPQFDKKVVRECLTYTGKQWIAGQISGFIGFIIGLYVLLVFPSMAFWTGLMLIPNALGNLVSMQGPMMGSAVPAFSESYNNGKKELCKYFIHSSLKYYGFVTCFMAVSLAVMASRLIDFVVIAFPDLRYYTLASVIVPSVILVQALSPLTGLPDKLFNACHRPLTPIVLGWILTPLGYFMQFLWLYLTVFTTTLPIWTYLMYPGFIVNLVRTIIAFWWIQRSLIKIDYKRIAWQAIVAPALAAVAYGLALYAICYSLWPALNTFFDWVITGATGNANTGLQFGVLAGSLVIIFLVLFVFPGGLYAPFSGLFGAWDEFTLEEFRKCALISGPSKGITMFIYKAFKAFSRVSPWYNKHPMNDYALVQKEARELVEEGKANRILAKK